MPSESLRYQCGEQLQLLHVLQRAAVQAGVLDCWFRVGRAASMARL